MVLGGGDDSGPEVKSKQDHSPRSGSALTLEEPASSLSLEIPTCHPRTLPTSLLPVTQNRAETMASFPPWGSSCTMKGAQTTLNNCCLRAVSRRVLGPDGHLLPGPVLPGAGSNAASLL